MVPMKTVVLNNFKNYRYNFFKLRWIYHPSDERLIILKITSIQRNFLECTGIHTKSTISQKVLPII